MSRRPARFFLLLASALGGCATASSLRVEPTGDPTRVTVIARLEAEPKREPGETLRFALVDPKTGKELSPLLADHQWDGELLRLTPRYALSRRRLYRATLVRPGRDPVVVDYRVPPLPPGKPARVLRIYPTADRLPANLLKFYIQFSKPMREGKYVFDHFHILDGTGRPVPDPWRKLDLWTPDSKRLTLWIHPGRVKTGVNLRRDLGPVLVAGKKYTLEIGAGLLDAEGRLLGRTVRKRFAAIEDDRTQPSIDRWNITLPRKAHTREPLTVRFPAPLDRFLLERYLRVLDPNGNPVDGEVRVGSQERRWMFLPAEPWPVGTYTLEADDHLEDLAGNTPERIFDTDLTAPKPPPARTRLPFRVDPR